MKTLLKQIKTRPLITIFLMICLIVASLSVSIINSIIDKQQQLMREGNIGYSYSKTLEYLTTPNNHFENSGPLKTLADLNKNEYYKKYETMFYTPVTQDNLDILVVIVNVKFNYFDKLSVLRVLDTSDMKNSVAIGADLYEKLGSPKTIKIFNREYRISHILGSKTDVTPFKDAVVLNYKILSKTDRNDVVLNDINNIVKFLNVKNVSSEDKKIITSFNGANDEATVGKTDFYITKNGNDEKQLDIKKAYEMQKGNISDKAMLFIIGISNIIIVSTFWIIDRRKEIAIRKAFGSNKMQITLMIFKELFILAITSSIISIILQYLFMSIGGKYFDFNITPSFINLIVVSIAAFVVSIIATIIPAKNALDMEISQCLKG